MSASERRAMSLPTEVLGVLLLFAAVAVEILVTYARIPARELYHVSGNGLEGGASRALRASSTTCRGTGSRVARAVSSSS